jgi:hypothetical protein
MSKRSFLGLALSLAGATSAQVSFSDHCDNGDPLPFAAIEVSQPIDKSCGLEGRPSATYNSHLQNKVKNNFCASATGGQPEHFTPQMLIDHSSRRNQGRHREAYRLAHVSPLVRHFG